MNSAKTAKVSKPGAKAKPAKAKKEKVSTIPKENIEAYNKLVATNEKKPK